MFDYKLVRKFQFVLFHERKTSSKSGYFRLNKTSSSLSRDESRPRQNNFLNLESHFGREND